MTKRDKPSTNDLIAALRERWLRTLNEATASNRPIAEEAINQMYRAHKMPAPLILWCESPAQLTVIPALVPKIVMSGDWERLCQHMSGIGTPGTQFWEGQWINQWQLFERTFVVPWLDKIWKFLFNAQSAQVRRRTLDLLQVHMKSILLDGRITASTFNSGSTDKAASEKGEGAVFLPIAANFQHDLIRLALHVETRSRSSFTPNPATVVGMFTAIFDHRIITQDLPKQIFKPKRSAEQRKRIEELRRTFEEFESLATARSAWLTRTMSGSAPMFDVSGIELDSDAPLYRRSWQIYKEANKHFKNQFQQPRGNQFATWTPSASWLPFVLSSRLVDPELFADLEESIDSIAGLWHGASGYLLLNDLCFLCEKPTSLIVNEAGRPHNSEGPAAIWPDGFAVWSWRGVVVDDALIKGRSLITAARVMKERNAEMRRVLLDLFGEERFLKESGATLVHEDKFGQLFRQDFSNDEPLMMVRVRNSTKESDGSYKHYYLRVPPTVTTAKQAVAWTFDLQESEYSLLEES